MQTPFRSPLGFHSIKKQEAQLSQRDRATVAWVSFRQNITGRRYCTEPYKSILNHCDVIGLLIYRIR